MTDTNHTPLDVNSLGANKNNTPHYVSLEKGTWMHIQWDLYSVILFVTGIIFIVSLLVWAYMQLA